MRVTISQRGEVKVLSLAGRLDAGSAPQVEPQVRELLNAGEGKLLLDLREVDYLSSAGLQILLLAAKRLEAGGGRLVLCGAGPYVLEVLQVTGLAPLFEMEPDCEQALERF